MVRFKDLSIVTKLRLLIGIFVCGMLFLGIVSYSAVENVRIGGALADRIELTANLLNDIEAPAASLEPSMFLVYRMLLSHSQGDIQDYMTRFTAAQKTFEERKQYWMANLPEGSTKDLLRKNFAGADQFFSVVNNEIFPLVKAGKMDEANEIRHNKALPIFTAFDEALAEVAHHADQDTVKVKSQAQATIRSRVTWMIVVLLVCLGLASTIGILISHVIASSVHEKVCFLERIAAGDLSQHVEVDSKDELGQLGAVLNEMTENLAAMVREIRGNSQTLSSASEELTSTSQQLGATSQETSTQANAVSAAAEQVSQNVATVSTATEEMTASIKEIAKNATDAAAVAGNAARLAATTNSTMTKLSESSAQIGNVIKVITSIAEQTNLLALNATIEAARAGEAGKGFAVVANEVKELAKETAKATEDIGQRVEAIQVDAKGAVSAIDEITSVIGKINDIQNTIASSVEEQTAATNEIARNIAETAKGSTEIASNITGVAQAALETQQSATGAQQAASDLSQLAHRLQDVVERFKLTDGNGVAHTSRARANGHAVPA
ncbi:MAG TPA: methyl-accepting chemotaxis protein [Candidatus Binataceae bacterium]|nr:methyl-accepting chemotaxis protein [Candidatus Binataceae bacterium]